MVLAVTAVTLAYFHFSSNLPELGKLSDYQPPLATRVFDADGKLIAEIADEHRILTPFDEIPKKLRDAFLAAEDQQFYEHPGINPARIISAALANLRAGHTVQGGSTITQQVAKNFLLSPERTYSRKIREIILAHRIEQRFSKDDILYLYLNQIYLGRGSYGVASAAWRYFHKRLDELTLAECAMLAGLPKAPSKYAPHINPKLAKKRRDTVLYLMQQSGFATPDEVARALKEPIRVAPLPRNEMRGAWADAFMRSLVRKFGAKTVRRQGMVIIAPYDDKAENAAIHAVRRGVLAIEQRQFYRYPVHHARSEWPQLLERWKKDRDPQRPIPADDEIIPALVEQVAGNGDLIVNDGVNRWKLAKPRWQWEKKPDVRPLPARFRRPARWLPGDEIRLQGDGKGGVRLTQSPSVQSALYAIDLERGTVLARVGGFDYKRGGFDRVSQAERQPGSAFKPFLYATAMEAGFTPASIIMDAPIVFDGRSFDDFWRPENYKNRFAGPVTLRNALEHSRNLAAIRLLQDVGIDRFRRALSRYAFQRDFPPQLALALGASEVTLRELTESYLVLASGGLKWKPVIVQQVQDRTGETVHRAIAGHRCQTCHADPVLALGESMKPAEPVLDPVDAFLVTNMLKGVIEHGTGRRARALGRPAAGKTGTTNKQVDAWFMGYTPQVLTGVWTGRDKPAPMGRHETGAHAALPTWLEAMKAFHQGKPVRDFTPPEGIEWVAIDADTGLLPGPDTEHVILEAFRAGTAPTKTSPPKRPDNAAGDSADFFELGL